MNIRDLIHLVYFGFIICCTVSCQTKDGPEIISDDEDGNTVEIQVGTRTVLTDKFTKSYEPVVPMWDEGIPTDHSLFPVLDNAEHSVVWFPESREEGAYNHYACLINFKGRFYAMWGNHPLGEDAPGQRVLFATSDNWGDWSEMQELFPAPGPVLERSESGIHLKSDRWAIVNDELYAIVYVHEAGRYPIARQVFEDGSLGQPFLLDELPSEGELPTYMEDLAPEELITPMSPLIKAWYVENDQISWWADAKAGVRRTGIDGSDLIESFMYRANDGKKVLMMRNWGTPSNPVHNNRMYVSFTDDNANWGPPYPTDIPDSPSRAQAISLEDGTTLLIGNQIVPRFDDALYLDRDPMTVAISRDGYVFDKVFTLRDNGPRDYRFTGVGGRNRGFAYSSSIIYDGWLYTFYSVRKEDMEITRVPLSDLE